MLDYAQNKSPRMKLISGQSDYQSNNLLIDKLKFILGIEKGPRDF